MIYKTILEICSNCFANPKLYNELTYERTLDQLDEKELNSLSRDMITLKYIYARKEVIINLKEQVKLLKNNTTRTSIAFLNVLISTALVLTTPEAARGVFAIRACLALCRWALPLSIVAFTISPFLTAHLIEKHEGKRQAKLDLIENIFAKMTRSREKVATRKVHDRHETILNSLINYLSKKDPRAVAEIFSTF